MAENEWSLPANRPLKRLFRRKRGSCCEQHAAPEQVEAAASEGLPLPHFQLAHVPFCLSAAPGSRECGPHRRAVLLQPDGRW